MSLTSYRAAPPRVNLHASRRLHRHEYRQMKEPPNLVRDWRPEIPFGGPVVEEKISTCALRTWQRLTLPRLETKYHQRWGVSRPCSEWERVQPPRHNHQVGKEHVVSRSCLVVPAIAFAMGTRNENDQADRAISTGKLHALPHFHTRPINVVVFHGSQGILVSRWVSRLDAFSGYPVRI